jgi:hypothetical protein
LNCLPPERGVLVFAVDRSEVLLQQDVHRGLDLLTGNARPAAPDNPDPE